ncbi:hypothetical protein Mapa_006958 [Marchantia paleacea]|nr:hypothetical protein Mapa_006958 [Marchantia paleacea]
MGGDVALLVPATIQCTMLPTSVTMYLCSKPFIVGNSIFSTAKRMTLTELTLGHQTYIQKKKKHIS